MQMIYLQFTVTGIKVGGVSLKIFLITIIYFMTYELIISNQFLEVCISVPWYLYSNTRTRMYLQTVSNMNTAVIIFKILSERKEESTKINTINIQWLYKKSNQTPVYKEKDGSHFYLYIKIHTAYILLVTKTLVLFWWQSFCNRWQLISGQI